MKKIVFTINLIILGFLFTACSSKKDELENRGYVTKFSDFSKVKPGVSTKADVIQVLGSPTTTSLFGQETWFYVGKEETKETFFTPETKNYDGYSISFNDKGIVSSVDKKDKSSLRAFNSSNDATPTSGNHITLMQQLMGNLGKFNPASKMGPGGTGGPGHKPSSPTPGGI